jgi:hypothetical protein
MQRFGIRRFLFVVLPGVITACQPTEEKQAAANVPRIELTHSLRKDSLLNSIVNRCMLSASIKDGNLQRLDSVSCVSDGEQAENIAMAASELWKNQFQLLVAYLAAHPKGCLRQQLVQGLSEDLSTNPNRKTAMKLFKTEAAEKVKKSALTAEEQKFLKNLVADVRPEMFD